MLCSYQVRKDIVKDEDGIEYTVFGIDAVDSAGKMIESVPDISFDKSETEKLAEEFNCLNLSTDCIVERLENFLDCEYKRK